MRRWFIVIFCLPLLPIGDTATADNLPVSGIYGTPVACRLFAAGGTVAVVTGEAPGVEYSDDDPILLVRPKELIGREWGCDTVANRTGKVLTLSCAGEGEDFTTKATMVEDRVGGRLDIAIEEGFSGTLWRCP